MNKKIKLILTFPHFLWMLGTVSKISKEDLGLVRLDAQLDKHAHARLDYVRV